MRLHQSAGARRQDGTYSTMPRRNENQAEAVPERIRFTARLSHPAYDALTEIQRHHRRKTGRALPLWRILDAALIAYAKRKGITVGE